MTCPVRPGTDDAPEGPKEGQDDGDAGRQTHAPHDHVGQWKQDWRSIGPLYGRGERGFRTLQTPYLFHVRPPLGIQGEYRSEEAAQKPWRLPGLGERGFADDLGVGEGIRLGKAKGNQ